MSLDTSGMLLEGIRVASGANPLTYPPRDIVTNANVFNGSQSLGRAEYMLYIAGQSTSALGIDIGDPNLSIFWSRNNASIIRFDYDIFARRWNTLPGGPPLNIGKFGNSPRIAAPVPDQTVSNTESPYFIFLGLPRTTIFSVQIVESDTDFGDPPTGTVQISLATGKLNWGSSDANNPSYQNQPVFVSQQSFNSRNQSKGIFGQLPLSSSESYLLFLNPIPGVGQIPRIRIGYQPYLNTISYSTEALLTTPPAGSVAWSQDTGRVLFSASDITANAQSNVYYDGVALGKLTFNRVLLSNINAVFPHPVGNNPLFATNFDSQRYIFFAQPSGSRYYFNVVFGDSSTSSLSSPAQGQILVDTATGNLYIGQADGTALSGASLYFIDSILAVERGVSVQFFRSGVNSSGVELTPDFTEKYLVTNQVVQSGITGSPFVQLPTVPLVDSNLAFNVQPTTSGGTFVGPLTDNTSPTIQATGYVADFDNKKINFSTRKTITQTLASTTPSIKLPDAAIFSQGVEVTRNSISLTPGVDFAFNANSGVLDFLQPIGEDDPSNILNLSGTVSLPNTFSVPDSVFSAKNVDMFLLVSEGANTNLYQILDFINPKTIRVVPDFVSAGAVQADVRAGREIIADRFFTNFSPPLRQFTISKGASMTGLFAALSQDQFSILINTGQINLSSPTKPGDVFQVSYIWNKSTDNGVTVTPTPVTEFAAFKVRQETATVVPNTGTILFNPNGKTVQPDKGITLYIDGVTQDPTSFNFVAPGTLSFNQILQSSNVVVVDYFIAESPGGNTSFVLTNNPIAVDYPQISVGATSSTFNGNQTSLLQSGGLFLLNGIDLVLIGGVIYDSASDTTTVQFDVPPNYSNGPAGSAPTKMQVCAPVIGGNAPNYTILESNPIDILPNNTNVISIHGQVQADYPQNTVVFIDGDPFLVSSATFDSSTSVTSVTLADKTLRNYIISTLQRTIRPVFQPGVNFQTSKTATLAFPLTLIDSGTNPVVLRQGIDYTVSDGGGIKLNTAIGFGSILNVLYVARSPQAAGTVFTFNYANAIAPNKTNGLLGQNLAMTYDLYSPDTFFFNIETIVSFIPVVIQTMSQNSSAGNGPNIQSQSSPQTKDQGTPGLYWLEQHLGNEDVVIQRLLKFYNDLINNYEDILSNIDGRVVGGINGKFRFSGTSQEVQTYNDITNDIDDKVVLYNNDVLTSFFNFVSVPVFGFMYEPNNLSRIYPTSNPFVTVALNNNNAPVINFGNTIGSTNIRNLTSVGTLSSSRASSPVVSAFPAGSNTIAIISENGDATNLIPTFSPGQTVQFTNPDGSPNGLTGTVSAIVGPDAHGHFTIGVSGVSISMLGGGLTQVISSSGHFYTPGRDFNVNNDQGTFTSNYLGLPSPPFPSVVHISGNELVDTNVTFVNSDTTPRRIPVLDGSTLSDNGRPAVPPLSRVGEIAYLNAESSSLAYIGKATVSGDTLTKVGSIFPLPIIGASGSAASISGISGVGASITSFSSPNMTVTGLLNMSPSLVGGSLVITGAATASNNGTFIITSYISSTSVQVKNTSGSSSDTNNGSLTWKVTASGSSAQTDAFALPLLTIKGLSNISPDLVGSSITISGSSNAGNNGTFTITAYVSSTSVQINNPNGTGSDSGPLKWTIAPSGVLVTGLGGASIALIGSSIKLSGASSSSNNGSFIIASVPNANTVVIINTGAVIPDSNNGAILWNISSVNQLVFINGPNAGIIATAISVTSVSIQVAAPFGANDPVGSDYYIIQPTGDLLTSINGETLVLSTSSAGPVVAPALIPDIDSELKSIETAILSFGQIQATGGGAPINTKVFSASGANFATAQPPITSASLLYISSGPNIGLYAISSVTDSTITIDPAPSYPATFPSVGSPALYTVIQPWSFISTKEPAFASSFQQNTLAFSNATSSWASDVTASGAAARLPVVSARLSALGTSSTPGFISTLEGLLGHDDNLYNVRYLWIQQRTDKTNGLLIQQTQAANQRVVNTQKLVASQQKLFITGSLLKAIS